MSEITGFYGPGLTYSEDDLNIKTVGDHNIKIITGKDFLLTGPTDQNIHIGNQSNITLDRNVTITNDLIVQGTIIGDQTVTASNIGNTGFGVFKQKVGNNLEFKKIKGSNKILVSSDLQIDLIETNVDHRGLSFIGNYDHNQIDSHIDNLNNPHSVTKEQVGLSNVENIKSNLSFLSPDVNDDVTLGYSIGSRWLDTTNKKEYVCLDSTENSAIWEEITNKVTSNSIISNIPTSTTSVLYRPVMSITPDPGTYLVTFSSSGKNSVGSTDTHFAIFKNDTIISHTERRIYLESHISDYVSCLHTQDIVEVNGSDNLNIKYRTNLGVFTVYNRSLLLLKIS